MAPGPQGEPGAVDVALTAPRRPPAWGRWTLACGAAETLGMAAAAGTAGLLLATVGEPHDWPSALTVWLGSIAGGAVEGLAVGAVQLWVLRPWLPRLPAPRWVLVTVAVALLGWALGMAFPALVAWRLETASDGGAATGPPLWLMALGGAAMGLVFGAGFGAAQAAVLRGHVARPWRWVTANALGWAAAMAVMMTGASAPSGPWPWPELLALGAATGILAGLAIGAVTGLFLPALDDVAPRGGPVANRAVLWLLRSPAHRLVSGALVDLRYTGARSGRQYALPVQYAEDNQRLVVWPGHPERKRWWRSLRAPAAVEVTLRGVLRRGSARVVERSDAAYAAALRTYGIRFPRARPGHEDPLVVVDLDPAC